MSPFAVFLWATSLICDCLYPYVLWHIKNTEKVLGDGRKVAGNKMEHHDEKRKQ